MPNFTVVYHDHYGYAHESTVFSIDSDCFLIIDEDKKFCWVPINDCEFLKYTDH